MCIATHRRLLHELFLDLCLLLLEVSSRQPLEASQVLRDAEAGLWKLKLLRFPVGHRPKAWDTDMAH